MQAVVSKANTGPWHPEWSSWHSILPDYATLNLLMMLKDIKSSNLEFKMDQISVLQCSQEFLKDLQESLKHIRDIPQLLKVFSILWLMLKT